MTRAARPALALDVLIASDRWQDAERAEAIVGRAIAQAAAALSTRATELAIVLSDDSAMRVLNRRWRGIDAATNVLSFPAKDAAGTHLGDIVLSFETIAREARAERKPFAHHLAHLAVHGFLHLLGYDHHRQRDALRMERTERTILHRLGVADPYRPATKPAARRTAKNSGKRVAKRRGRRLRKA